MANWPKEVEDRGHANWQAERASPPPNWPRRHRRRHFAELAAAAQKWVRQIACAVQLSHRGRGRGAVSLSSILSSEYTES